MSGAEVFRVIDVLAAPEPEEVVWKDPRGGAESPNPTTELAKWSSPAPDTAMIARRPAPMIELEYLNLPSSLDRRLEMLCQPTSERARSYRLLRHRLLSQGDPRVIAVTSARPAEGKTTCASNLALAIAEDMMVSVLLLDANLRRPELGRLFGFEPRASFVADMTRFTHLGPPYPVVGIDGARLHVAALPDAPIPQGRLDRTSFSVALLDLRSVYDYVVIDTASVLESGDADVVGESADGLLVAARAGVSRKADVRRAIDLLRPTTVLGSVLLDS